MNIFSYLKDEAQKNTYTKNENHSTDFFSSLVYYRWWIFARNEHIIIIKWWKKYKRKKTALSLVIIIRSVQRYIYYYCVLGFAINWSRRRAVDIVYNVVMLVKLVSAGRVSWAEPSHICVASRHCTNAAIFALAQFRFLNLHWIYFVSFFFVRIFRML